MISIDKMEAFELVVRALEKEDGKTASEMMKIIAKSIKDDKENNRFSQQIEVVDKKDEKLIKELLNIEH